MYKKIVLFLALFGSVQPCVAIEPNTFVATIGAGVFNSPINIVIAPNGLRGYVNDTGTNSVVVIDTDPLSPTFHAILTSITGFNNPSGIAVTPDSQYVYVCDGNTNSVIVIKASDNTIESAPNLANAFNNPNALAVTLDGSRVYVCNYGNNSVSVIQRGALPSTDTVVNPPALSGILNGPYDIVMTPDGDYAYISGTNSSVDINVIDLNTDQQLTSLSNVNDFPEGLAVTPDGKFVYVAGSSARITIIDTSSNTVLTPASLNGVFNAPNDVVVTPDGNYAYVTNFLGASGSISSVSVIDTDPSSPTYNSTLSTPGLVVPNTTTTRFLTLAITPDASRVYVVDGYNNSGSGPNPVVYVIYTGSFFSVRNPSGLIGAPENVSGCKMRNSFFTQTDHMNHLTWSAPVTGNAPVAYAIYRDAGLTELVGTVSARSALQYKHHNRNPNVDDTYYMIAIDSLGNTSTPAIVTVTQRC